MRRQQFRDRFEHGRIKSSLLRGLEYRRDMLNRLSFWHSRHRLDVQSAPARICQFLWPLLLKAPQNIAC